MFSLKHIEKWSSLLIVRTPIYFSIALEIAIGPNNVFILSFSKLSAISNIPKFAIVNVEFNLIFDYLVDPRSPHIIKKKLN